MSNMVEVIVKSTDQTSTGFKSADKGAKDLGASFDKVGESADGAESKAQGFADTLTGTKDVAGGLGEIMKGNLFEGFVQVGAGAADLAGGMASFLIPAIKNGITGFKGAATAAKAFTLSLLTNPVFLIGAAIVALVAGLVILYKKSETARNIMNQAFSSIGQAVLFMSKVGIEAFKFLIMTALSAASTLLNIAAKIPGPQQAAMKKAAEAFEGFKESAGKALDAAGNKVDEWSTKLKNMPKVAKLEGNITDLEKKLATAKTKLGDKKLTATQTAAVKADIRQLEQKVAAARAALASVKSKTVTITYRGATSGIVRTQDLNTIGSAGREASGGFNSGLTWVGENGPELMDKPPGTQVHSAASSKVKASQAGSTGGVTTLVLKSDGSKLMDLLVEVLRKAIANQGGDVQVVLGR